MTDNDPPDISETSANEELARRLCCAYVSYVMGNSYAHTYNSLVKDLPLADYWFNLAEKIQSEAPR